MQTNYQIPGVYLEEVFPTPAPELITGVPVFLGLTNDRDAKGNSILFNTPQRLTIWPQFEQKFGQPLTNSYLFYAVRGFFENGGRLCYVVLLQDSTQQALEAGLDAIATLDTIDLVCLVSATDISKEQLQSMQRAILEHCEQMGDRFAILDAPNISSEEIEPSEEIEKYIQHLLPSNNGAVYAPWIKVENYSELIPPCGHIAGVYARSDRSSGIHQSPANYILEGVLDVKPDLAELNFNEGVQINCIRAFSGRGIRIWGTRTLSQDPAWRYINVRRLFISVRRWVQHYLADIAFEPNDFQLWLRIERELTSYFESLLRQGALKGRTSQEAFYVKCDAQTNPPEVRDAGMVVTEIGLAPSIPNEFIIVRLIHGETGVTLTSSSSS